MLVYGWGYAWYRAGTNSCDFSFTSYSSSYARALFGRYLRFISPYALFETFVTLIERARTKGTRPDRPKQQRGTSKNSKNRKSVWKYQEARCLSTSLGGTHSKNMIECLCKIAVQGGWALSFGYYDISKGCFPFWRYSKKGAFSSGIGHCKFWN